MNQILNNGKLIIKGYKKSNSNKMNIMLGKKITNRILIYKFVFLASLISILFSVSYSIYGYYNRTQQDKISESLYDVFNISTLYASNNSYTIEKVNQKDNIFSVIGIIKIDSIKISYPILSNISDELLKISPCRFFGPFPNEIGNLCIAAHNYDDNRFFSKIVKLKNNDIITIFDNTGKYTNYYVYNVYETQIDDISCTSQETYNKKEVTLVTCNNLTGNRIIVKAKEN